MGRYSLDLSNSFGFGRGVRLRDQFRRGLRFWLLILLPTAAACFIAGGWITYTALREGTQLEITCEEYVTKRPTSHWLKLTGCEYDFEHYGVKYKEHTDLTGDDISAIYLPLHPVGDTLGPIHVVVKHHDKNTLQVFEALEEGREPSPAAVEKLRTELAKPVEGLVISKTLGADDRDDIRGLELRLDQSFVVVEYGRGPNLGFGIFLLGIGGLAGTSALLMWLMALRRRRADKRELPKAVLRTK
jgi:hypothetical protein